MRAARKATSAYENKADSIDGLPTYQVYVLEHGAVAHAALHAAFEPLREIIVAHAREAVRCPSCELCDVLLRRYVPNERCAVPAHRDISAYATAILTLNAHEFGGGYFVTTHEGSDSEAPLLGTAAARRLHLPLDTGDLLIHDCNVLHGVNVTWGERYALVSWFKDRPGVCAHDEHPWIAELATERADADAMALMATFAEKRGDEAGEQLWATRAADAGHAGAMIQLAMRLYRSREAAERTRATKLIAEASRRGRRDAMAIYAWALDQGAGARRDAAKATRWRRRAAALGHTGAQSELKQAGLDWSEG